MYVNTNHTYTNRMEVYTINIDLRSAYKVFNYNELAIQYAKLETV